MAALVPAKLEFGPEGTPFSETYGDVYHTIHGGPAQARHVFLGGNDLPQRWQNREGFVIFETGFGLGLNFLATWRAWLESRDACQTLHFVSIEKHPFSAADLTRAHHAWPEFADLSQALTAAWPPLLPGIHQLSLNEGRVILTLVFADATEALRKLDLAADAFYLDGFSPARNPELWTPWVCKALARLAAPGATLATWSVAAGVRQSLQEAEFDLEKRPGFAGKREMLTGRYRSRRPPRFAPPGDKRVIIIGAGAAGSSAAAVLAAKGWQVCVLERESAPGQGASGNIAGVFRPLPSADDNHLARLTRAGFLATRRHLQWLEALGLPVRWDSCGVLHLARDEAHEHAQRKVISALAPPEDYLQFIDRAQAAEKLGYPVEKGGWWFPSGGWVQPHALCRANLMLDPQRITARFNCTVARIEAGPSGWKALDSTGQLLAEAPHLVMASGVAATDFEPLAWLPQIPARGQVSHLPAEALQGPDCLVCGHGYLAPAVDGIRVAGATHTAFDLDPDIRLADHKENLRRINELLPGATAALDPASLQGRVGFRPMSPDRLPIVGPVPDAARVALIPPHKRRLTHLPLHPGLWALQGFGARGIVWSALMAQVLAAQMDPSPLPLETDLRDALLPGRFLLRGEQETQQAPMADEVQ